MAAPNRDRIDRNKLKAIRGREDALFSSRIVHSTNLVARSLHNMPGGVPMSWMKGLYRTPPIYIDRGEGPRFFDVDGNAYLDFNVCDLSMTMGYGPKPVVDAISRQAAKGTHFLLPTEDAVVVSELLAERTGVPYWQFTLSASGANTEVLRTARFLTGRSKIAVFTGHYHGHIDETLVAIGDGKSEPALLGLPCAAASNTFVVPFNSLESLESVLIKRDIALVLTEPALTNCNVILPQPDYLAGVRELTRQHGTLLCLDEAHTFQFAYGGLVGAWQLDPDFVVLGKGLGTGVSFALYGMSGQVAEAFEKHIDVDIGPSGIATGGTLYGSAIAAAAARAALIDILTPDAYDNVYALGKRLADGLDRLFTSKNLPWTAFRLGPRSGYCLSETLPLNYDQAKLSLDYELIDTRRVFMANRGVWDAVASAGPQASFAHTESDVDEYLAVADQFLGEIVAESTVP